MAFDKDDPMLAMTRCLAILVVCSEAVTTLSAGVAGLEAKTVDRALLGLLLNLNMISGGDGERIRRDAHVLATRLGAQLTILDKPGVAREQMH